MRNLNHDIMGPNTPSWIGFGIWTNILYENLRKEKENCHDDADRRKRGSKFDMRVDRHTVHVYSSRISQPSKLLLVGFTILSHSLPCLHLLFTWN